MNDGYFLLFWQSRSPCCYTSSCIEIPPSPITYSIEIVAAARSPGKVRGGSWHDKRNRMWKLQSSSIIQSLSNIISHFCPEMVNYCDEQKGGGDRIFSSLFWIGWGRGGCWRDKRDPRTDGCAEDAYEHARVVLKSPIIRVAVGARGWQKKPHRKINFPVSAPSYHFITINYQFTFYY